MKNRNHIQHLEIYQSYFKLLHQSEESNSLLKAADEMIKIYEKNSIPLEWICKIFIEKGEEFENDVLDFDIEIYITKLLELNSTSILGLMASGSYKFKKEDFVGARDVLVKGMTLYLKFPSFNDYLCDIILSVNTLKKNWNSCIKLLSIIHLKFRAYLLAEILFEQLKDYKLELAECLIEQKKDVKIDEGIIICEELLLIHQADPKKQVEVLDLLTKALIYRKLFDKAEKCIDKLQLLGATEENLALLKAVLLRFINILLLKIIRNKFKIYFQVPRCHRKINISS